MDEDTTHWPLVGVGVALIISTLIGTCHSRADVPKEHFNRATALVLGQALVGEGGSALDHAIIAHLLHRRWEATRARVRWSFSEQVRAYCAPLRPSRRSRRARRIRALTWATLPADVRGVVEAFNTGTLRDPCPSAWHFDRRESLHWIRLPRVCARLETANVFYGRP